MSNQWNIQTTTENREGLLLIWKDVWDIMLGKKSIKHKLHYDSILFKINEITC